MRETRKTVALVVSLALMLGAAIASHRALLRSDAIYKSGPNDALYLPKPELFRAASFGFTQLAADLLWARTVQSVGDIRARGKGGFKFIYPYADIVTDVDPLYATPYIIANFWLTGWDQVTEANKILEKGWKRFPDNYKFPYNIGLNYFLWLHEREKAIDYFSRAAKLRKAPESWKRSVGRAIERSNDPGAAFGMFVSFYNEAEDRREREAMEPLMVHGLYYELATQLNGVVDRYRTEHGGLPRTLDDLVTAGYIQALPKDPYGGQLYLDENGKTRSTIRPRYWWDAKVSN